MKMVDLVIVRHGQSQANRDNIFTGWTDVDLSPKGVEEAKDVGGLIGEPLREEAGFHSRNRQLAAETNHYQHHKGVEELALKLLHLKCVSDCIKH